MNDNRTNHDWKKAIEICKDLDQLSHEEALAKIKELNLSDSITAKANSIMSRLNEEHEVFDNNPSKILNKAQTNDFNNLIGKTIDSYKIIELIAKGGMSSVFKAEKILLGVHKPVALKILSPYVFSDKSVELFNREQLILSQLEHPNIVSFHHSGQTEDGTRYLVMEYIDEAQTITDYSQNHQLSTNAIIKLVYKLAKVFIYAHNNLIIHRDVKPTNILVDNQGTLKVIDFGIGQIISKHDKTSTQVYTKNSASPEQILGENVSIQTDVFSLGAVMLELLVNKNPLPETNITNYNPQNDVKHINKLLKDSSLDSDLKNIIHTAMHIDTAKRYASMDSFSQDLNNWMNKRPVNASSDTKIYKIKKFVIRNPLSFALSLIIFVSMLTGIVVVNNYASKAQKEAEKAKTTLSLITQVFNPTDSWNPPEPNKSLQQALDEFSENKLPSLDLDKDIRTNLHKTLGEIYINYGLYKKSHTQFQAALSLFTPSELNNSESALYIQYLLGTNQRILGQNTDASTLLRKTHDRLVAKFPNNYNLRLEILTSLMDSYYGVSTYQSDAAHNVEKEILETIASGKVDDKLEISSAYDALAVKAQFQQPKDFELAKQYLNKALNIVNIPQYTQTFEYYNLQRTLAHIEIRQDNYQLGGDILLKLINKIKNTNPDNTLLNRLYEDYSTVLFKMGKYKQSINALTQAIEISNLTNSESWLYFPLSKRAMYHIRLNDFKSGLVDQMNLIPIAAKYKTNNLADSFNNLSFIMHSLGHTDIGEQLTKLAIANLDQDGPYYIGFIEYYYLASGINNWFAKDTVAAKSDHANSIEYIGEKDSIYRKILDQLLYPNKIDIISLPKKLTVTSNLLFLLQSKDKASELSLQQVQNYCAIPDDYINMKIIAIKELFLDNCKKQYLKLKIQIPNKINTEIKAIAAAKISAQQISKEEIKLQLKDYIN